MSIDTAIMKSSLSPVIRHSDVLRDLCQANTQHHYYSVTWHKDATLSATNLSRGILPTRHVAIHTMSRDTYTPCHVTQ